MVSPTSSEQTKLITNDDETDTKKPQYGSVPNNETSSNIRFQVAAILCTMLLSFGSHYAALTLGALKNTIKEKMGIDNTQYGLVQSSVALVNTILPLLGGVFVDWFGTTTGSLVATSFILLGNIVVALSTNLVSFPLMVFGRALYGIGSGTVVIVQETIIAQWFSGKGLAVTLGANVAVSRLASFLGMATIVPIAQATGFYGNALWFSAFLCFLSWIANITYYTMIQLADKKLSPEALARLKAKKQLKLSHAVRLPAQFWLLILLAVVMMGGWNTFLHINAELIKLKFGASDKLAALKASVSQILPIFAPPLLGFWIEKRGKRPTLLFMAAIMFMLSMYLIGYTESPPTISMICFSISLALGVVPMLSSIPLILPAGAVGTGFGIYKTAWSIGSVLQDIIAGKLQNDARGHKHSYDNTMIFMTAVSFVSVLIALGVYLVDRVAWKSYLSQGVLNQNEFVPLSQTELSVSTPTSFKPRWYNIAPPFLLVLALVTSWVLFIVYFF